MTERQPIETTNLDRYGNEALPWSRAWDVLEALDPSAPVTWFLGTVRRDGRPHAAGVGAMWHDGDLYFTSGDVTRKSRDLASNPAGTISVSLSGIDLVSEGDALTAPFSAPSAGPPPWNVYRLGYDTVYGVAGAEPHGATRWRFAA